MMKKKKTELSCKKQMYLPEDVLSEILSWLDMDSLVRFKTVCKEWRSLIEDPKFIGNHIMKSGGQWVFETPVDNGPAYYDKYEYLDSYIGLLLEHSNNPINLRLTNPSTGKILELPYPGCQHRPKHMKMCHINSSNILKLVVPCRYYRNSVRRRIRAFMVLTLGVDVTWREIDIPFRSRSYDCGMETVMIRDVYFMLWLSGYSAKEVICLEMENEVSRITLPKGFDFGIIHAAPLAWGESLAIGCVRKAKEGAGGDDDVHIWVLEDRKKNRWAEKEIVVPLKFVDRCAYYKMDLWASTDKGLLVNCCPNEVVLLDVPSGKIKWRYHAPQGIWFTGKPNLRRFASPSCPNFWKDGWSPPQSPEYFGYDDADFFEEEDDPEEEDV